MLVRTCLFHIEIHHLHVVDQIVDEFIGDCVPSITTDHQNDSDNNRRNPSSGTKIAHITEFRTVIGDGTGK
jgi:hypothetical protein